MWRAVRETLSLQVSFGEEVTGWTRIWFVDFDDRVGERVRIDEVSEFSGEF
jgi:hypothetical protein